MATAYAVYRAGRQSLTFYKGDTVPTVDSNSSSSGSGGSGSSGSTNPDAITAVYTGIETDVYATPNDVPWRQYQRTITTIDFVDTISPVSTAFWFYEFLCVTSINVEKLDVSNVTNMEAMFYRFGQNGYQGEILTSLDLNTWNTSKVENMTNMFFQITGINKIYVSDSWSTESVTESNLMFSECVGLIGGNGTTYNSANIDATYARIDTPKATGYFTDWEDHPDNKFVRIKDFTLRKIGRALRSAGSTETYLPSEMDDAIYKLTENWVNNFTLEGTYLNHVSVENSSFIVDKFSKMGFLTVQSIANTAAENIFYNAGNIVLPEGVTFLTTQAYGGSTSGSTNRYFTAAFAGINGKVDMVVDFVNRNTTNDFVCPNITMTYV